MPLSFKHDDILREIATMELRQDRRDAARAALDEIEDLTRELSKVKKERDEALRGVMDANKRRLGG